MSLQYILLHFSIVTQVSFKILCLSLVKASFVISFFRDKTWEQAFIHALDKTSFEGVTGPVRFKDNSRRGNIVIQQIVRKSINLSLLSNPIWEVDEPVFFAGAIRGGDQEAGLNFFIYALFSVRWAAAV